MPTAIFFNVPAHAHINPTMPLVRELVGRGEHIIYYATEEFCAAIEATGAIFRSYGDAYPFSHTFDENLFKVTSQSIRASEIILDTLLEEIRALCPDYIIHDMLSPWGYYIAQILGIPSIRSIPIPCITPKVALDAPSYWRELITYMIDAKKDVWNFNVVGAKLSKKYHVKRWYLDGLAIFQDWGDLNIVFTSKEYQPYADSFDERYKFVGASILERSQQPDFPFEVLDQRPNIYISLGTSFNEHPEFFQACIAAFKGSPWQIIMSVGHAINPENLEHIPDNFIIQRSVPQLEILQRAALFISAGGGASVSEAFYYGVPFLVIPQGADQPWQAYRIEQLGAGKRLHRKQVTSTALYQGAKEILEDPKYAQSSKQIGESLKRAGGYIRAADEIQKFIAIASQRKKPVVSTVH